MQSIDESIQFVQDLWLHGEAPGPQEPYLVITAQLTELKEYKKNPNKDTVGDVIEDMCSHYCKYPDTYDEDAEGIPLADSEICQNCPLNRL